MLDIILKNLLKINGKSMEKKEIKEKAIVLRSTDSGEADRIITLLVLGYGKIVAKIKGVKKPKAKLAYASFPFNLGEYIVLQTGKSYSVINCSFIDNFGNLASDLNKYYVGAGILDVVDRLTANGSPCDDYFLLILKSLNELCYNENANVINILTKFLVDVLAISGFKMSSDIEVSEKESCFFDFAIGKLTNVYNDSSVKLSFEEAKTLVYMQQTAFNDLDFKIKPSKNVLKLLILFFEDKTDLDLKIFKKFL